MTDIHKKSGSALLIALFLMATLGVLSFGVSRIYVSEIKTTDNFVNTTAAYYGAESALEQSLLAYRANPDVQIGGGSQDGLIPSCDTRTSGTQTCQVGITDQFLKLSSTPLLNGAQIQIMTRVSYLGDITQNKCTESKPCPLEKDHSAEVTLPSASNLTLHWRWDASDVNNNVLKINYIDNNSIYLHDQSVVASQTSQILTDARSLNNNVIADFHPLSNGISYWFSNDGSSKFIDTGNTTIDAVGLINGVNRQLEVVINRSNGQVSGVLDYTLFGQNNIQ